MSVLLLTAIVTGIAATANSRPEAAWGAAVRKLPTLKAPKRAWSQEKKALEKALQDPGRRMQTLHRLVRGSIHAEEWSAARQYTRELLMADSQNVSLLKTLALCDLRVGDPMVAIATAQKALALSPDDSEIPLLIAEAVEAASPAEVLHRTPVRRIHP